MHRQTLFLNPQNALQIKLETAMQFAINTCTLGTDNRYDDYLRTGGWNNFQRFRYNREGQYVKRKTSRPTSCDRDINLSLTSANKMSYPHGRLAWFYRLSDYTSGFTPFIQIPPRNNNQSPLDDPQFKLTTQSREMLAAAMLTATKRIGNCRERADLVMKYLWENPKGIHKIEVISTQTFDHCFVVVNRKGDLHQPSTWGNARIIDAWYESGHEHGLILRAHYFNYYIKQVKRFAKEQATKLPQLGMFSSPMTDEIELLKQVEYAIEPDIDRYPTYSTDPFYPVDYYYHVINAYPADLQLNQFSHSFIEPYFNAHKNKFKDCLAEIEKQSTALIPKFS